MTSDDAARNDAGVKGTAASTERDPRACPSGGRHDYVEVAEKEDGWADNSILYRCTKCGAQFWHHNTFC